MAKLRLDQLLVERDLAPSRARAQAMILAGEVIVGEHRADKPGVKVDPDASVRLRPRRSHYVSRAGAKLEHALDLFGVTATDVVALDAGASTGGFVGVLLERGARRVYAVDVGYGQLDPRLSQDPRVVVRDRCNLRHLDATQVSDRIDLFTLDLSFISLTKVLETTLSLAAPIATWVCLVKPQFEVGPDRVGKGGIVRDPTARAWALAHVRGCAEALGLRSLGDGPSPITGQKGNVEHLLALRRP